MEEVKAFRSLLNLTTPLAYTPAFKLSDTITVKMPSHELKILNWPYSVVLSKRVKMGVVMNEIPRCMKAQIKNQKEALTCAGIVLYLFFTFSNIILSLAQYFSYCLYAFFAKDIFCKLLCSPYGIHFKGLHQFVSFLFFFALSKCF